jgi:hypothetical protein
MSLCPASVPDIEPEGNSRLADETLQDVVAATKSCRIGAPNFPAFTQFATPRWQRAILLLP